MSEIRKRNSVQVNEAGKQKLIEAKAAKRNYEGRVSTDLEIATDAGVSEKSVERFFGGTAVAKKTAVAITQSLGLELAELIDPPKQSNASADTPELKQTAEAISWRDICHKMLDEQLRRYQFRRQATCAGLGHEVNIYVPLGLVKPTIQPRRGEEFCPTPAEGSLQYQPSEKEIEKRFEHDEFLWQVIEAGEGKNIAIIGEPGAGKSTWLEQIARHLKDSEKVSGLPICIQLGSLDGKTLEEYLLQVWLKEALSLQGIEVSAEVRTGLMQLFNSRQVWLLLDGVDEIRVGADTSARAHNGAPLQGIANQLTGWVVQARTVLTCRLNVWHANDRALPNFETYRTLDFDDPQVGEFIRQWFAKAGKLQLGEQLQNKLGESGRERIRDLIRNPLRLALLCQTWAVKPGELPKTKATLYQRFREYFYDWKKIEFPASWNQRQELNTALGRLAVTAIENQTQLRESLAYEVMGESLFELAQQIGWLNLVYRDAETDEPVYAFFHLTFQEYFAALAIDDWRFFLTHDNENPQPLPGNVYRIFEPQWKEVILLWLGRDKREVADEQKEQFIQALVEFEDGCYGFYWLRAYFLAAAGIAEFTAFVDCSFPDGIVEKVVSWAFGYFNFQTHGWSNKFPVVAEQARAVLQETDRSKAIDAMTKLLSPYVNSLIELAGIQLDKEIPREVILGYNEGLFHFVIVVLLSLLKLDPESFYGKETLKNLVNIFNPIDWHLDHLRYDHEFNTLINKFNRYFSNSDDFLINQDKNNFPFSSGTVDSLMKKVHPDQEDNVCVEALLNLKNIIKTQQCYPVETLVEYVKKYWMNLDYIKQPTLNMNCYEVIWHCAQNMCYPAFYQAWHHAEVEELPTDNSIPTAQNLNPADLPKLLHAAINNDSQLRDKVQPICIDGSKFIDHDNPTLDIYDQLMNQGFPERQNGEPETLQQLKVYWHQLRRKSDHQLVLVFYESTAEKQGFSETFLNALSKFDGAICVVSDQLIDQLRSFSPDQLSLAEDILSWVKEIIKK